MKQFADGDHRDRNGEEYGPSVAASPAHVPQQQCDQRGNQCVLDGSDARLILGKFEKNVRNLSIPSAYLEYTPKLQSGALIKIKKSPRPVSPRRAERVFCKPYAQAVNPLSACPGRPLVTLWPRRSKTLGA